MGWVRTRSLYSTPGKAEASRFSPAGAVRHSGRFNREPSDGWLRSRPRDGCLRGARFAFSTKGHCQLVPDRDWAHLLRPRRRFDQRPQEPQTRINEAIRVPQVRLIDADGAQIGIKSTEDAQKYAWDKNLDL